MQEVLNDKLTLISVNISTFSGYRRATRENIASLGGSLPDSEAITEGSIKVFPCEGTKTLQTIRRGLFREVQSHGIRALGSQNVFAVLTDDLPEIEKKIEQAKAEFSAEVSALDAKYENIFESHVSANSEAEAVIRSLKIDRATAVSRCRFSTDVFKIAPFVREGESEEEGVEGIVRGLGRQLYEETSSSMDKLLKNDAFAKNQRVGQKTLRPLKAEVQKMQKLAFLDPSIEGAVKLVTDILAALPAQGYIEKQDFITLEKLVDTMADPDALFNAACKVKNGVPACDVLFPPAPVQQAPVQQSAENPAVPLIPPAAIPVQQKQVVALPPVILVGQQSVKPATAIPVKGSVPPLPPGMSAVLRQPGSGKSNVLIF